MNIGILLWNTCNAVCAHCAVNSGPNERPVMTDEQIFSAIDSAFYDCSRPSIGLSGGEAFVFFERLVRIIDYASSKGALVSVTTNGYWAISLERAIDKIRRVKDAGLCKLVVSTDAFHKPYIPQERVINAIRACMDVHLEVELQYVSSKRTPRLYEFLKEYGSQLLNITVREIPVHPVGRAATEVQPEDFFSKKRIPSGLCPSAIPSFSAMGDVIPCCNTAGHLPSLKLGSVDDDLPALYDRFRASSLMSVLWGKGPAALYAAARSLGMDDLEHGYIDQCHLCHHLFSDFERGKKLWREADEIVEKELYENYMTQFRENYSRLKPSSISTSAAS